MPQAEAQEPIKVVEAVLRANSVVLEGDITEEVKIISKGGDSWS
jgi:hypothetical protein